MPRNKSIICFDLDGTILPFNSFKFFVPFAILWLIVTLKPRRLFFLLSESYRKSRGKIVHLTYKKAVCNATLDMGVFSARLFARTCLLMKRPLLYKRIQNYLSAEAILVLCTAAPAKYAQEIAYLLGFNECLAFGSNGTYGTDQLDNIREEKLKQFLLKYDYLDQMYGDHSDDLNMFNFAQRATVVHPNSQQRKKILAVLPTPEIIE